MEQKTKYAEEMRFFTTDEQGRRVLRGLTTEETEWYLERRCGLLSMTNSDTLRFLELHDRHERARVAVLAVEADRTDNPPRN